MRIRRALLVSPNDNNAFGVFAVALSFFVFAYSTLFGQLPILVYYAVWLPLVLVEPRRYLSGNGGLAWIMAFACFALLSTFWSAAPSTTARASVQYVTHIACALVAARTVSVRTLCLGGLVGVVLVLAYSLAFGRFLYDPLDGSYTFVGAFSSKNQLGFFASLGIFFAFSLSVLLRGRGWVTPLLCVAAGGLSLWSLVLSQSATSMISIVFALAAAFGARALQAFAPLPRSVLSIAGGVLIVFITVAALQMGAFDAVLGAFGKDSTLTGRTYLWSQGIAAARENPLFGQGYYAYWVRGFAEAERLWEEFYITARSGFHFHNTYIETAVELGLFGLILLLVPLFTAAVRSFLRLFREDGARDAQILFGLVMLLVLRSFVEVDIINPYVVGSFLIFYAAGYSPARFEQTMRVIPKRDSASAPVFGSM